MNIHRARALRTAAAFGVDRRLSESIHGDRLERLRSAAQRLEQELKGGGVAIVTGPSGAGKSTLLRLLSSGAVRVRSLRQRERALAVAALGERATLARWLSLLARFGLAEARVLLTRAGELSSGERARLELALAALACERRAGCETPPTLVADELCSMLDRPMAVGVALGAARWARQGGARLIGATAHGDLAGVLGADITLNIDEQGGVRWIRCGLSRVG